jgi:sugar-specific transcriptional regulator TrmB
MPNNKIKETLKSLGMTNNEVEIYLALLNKIESSANDIVSASGLHRQVCYDALDRLLEKGFASYILKKNKTYFKPLDPKKIINHLDERIELVDSVLPQLNAIAKSEKTKTEVEVIKGSSVLKKIDKDIIKELKEKKDTTIYSTGVDLNKSLKFDKIATKQYFLRLKKNKLKEKSLFYGIQIIA